jgi:hypothetical protein
MMVFQIDQHNKLKVNHSELIQSSEIQRDSFIQRESYLKQLIAIDSLMYAGEFDDVLSLLKEYSMSYSEELPPYLSYRIASLDQMLSSDDSTNMQVRLIMGQLREKEAMIDQLQNEIDSNQFIFSDSIASIKEKIAKGQEEVKQLKQQLQTKERIQVINFANEKGAKIHYLGEVSEKKANGGGIGIWNTGSVYRGEWQNNKRHGKGQFEWSDGTKYEGEYQFDKRHGKGNYSWPSGEKYDGEWKDDKRNGFGTLYDMDGNIQFEGQWENDKIKS